MHPGAPADRWVRVRSRRPRSPFRRAASRPSATASSRSRSRCLAGLSRLHRELRDHRDHLVQPLRAVSQRAEHLVRSTDRQHASAAGGLFLTLPHAGIGPLRSARFFGRYYGLTLFVMAACFNVLYYASTLEPGHRLSDGLYPLPDPLEHVWPTRVWGRYADLAAEPARRHHPVCGYFFLLSHPGRRAQRAGRIARIARRA